MSTPLFSADSHVAEPEEAYLQIDPAFRDRLAQAYGEEHRFEIRSPESGGFSVLIELPYETKESPALSEAQAAPAQALSQKPSAPPAVVPSALPPNAPQTT